MEYKIKWIMSLHHHQSTIFLTIINLMKPSMDTNKGPMTTNLIFKVNNNNNHTQVIKPLRKVNLSKAHQNKMKRLSHLKMIFLTNLGKTITHNYLLLAK